MGVLLPAMNELQLILIGVALGAIPSATLGQIMVAYLAKKAGLNPKDIQAYSEAVDGEDSE